MEGHRKLKFGRREAHDRVTGDSIYRSKLQTFGGEDNFGVAQFMFYWRSMSNV